MNIPVKWLLFRTPLYTPLRRWSNRWRHPRQYQQWLSAGRPVPPPHVVKYYAVREHAQRFDCSTLVETGTFTGGMIAAALRDFRAIYSIELDPVLAATVQRMFRRQRHVQILQGDSSVRLTELLGCLEGRVLFWLDAHYSGGVTARGAMDCPLFQELDQILKTVQIQPVILIDDARDFTGQNGYPSVAEIQTYIGQRQPEFTVDVQDDIIRILPPFRLVKPARTQ